MHIPFVNLDTVYFIYICLWIRRERVVGDLHPLIFIFFFFFSILPFTLLRQLGASNVLYLIAFPSERQGRKLSRPAFAITCISRQIHTYAFPFHTYWLWRGIRTSQRSKESVFFFFFLGGFCFQKFFPPTSIWTCFDVRQTRLVSLLESSESRRIR